MADKNNRWEQNAPGKFYVDKACIACDTCVLAAPSNFKMGDGGDHAFLNSQPATPEEEAQCHSAVEQCPVEAIGSNGE